MSLNVVPFKSLGAVSYSTSGHYLKVRSQIIGYLKVRSQIIGSPNPNPNPNNLGPEF